MAKCEKCIERSFQINLEINFLTHTFQLRHNSKKRFFWPKNRNSSKKKDTNTFMIRISWNEIKLNYIRRGSFWFHMTAFGAKLCPWLFFLTNSIIFLQFANVCKLIEKNRTKLHSKLQYLVSVDSWQTY